MPITQTQDHTAQANAGYVHQTNDEIVTAKQDCEVTQDVNGAKLTFLVKADQPVPPDLVNAYVEQHGDPREKSERKRERGEAKKD